MQNIARLFFSVILHCYRTRKGDTINFKFGGRLTTCATLQNISACLSRSQEDNKFNTDLENALDNSNTE